MNLASLQNFEKYTEKLIDEIIAANMYWELWCDLTDSKKDYLSCMYNSPHFWNVSFNAYLESTRVSLCRIYDTHKESINLLFWLTTIKTHLLNDEFSKWYGNNHGIILDSNELDSDIDCVNDELVKSLIKHRNNHIAHISKSSLEMGCSWFIKTPLTKDNITFLVNKALNILTKYYSIIFKKVFLPTTTQREDYCFILDSIKGHSQRIKQEWLDKFN